MAEKLLRAEWTYIWVKESPLVDASGFGSRPDYAAGDEIPYDDIPEVWDEFSDGIAVLDEDGELIEDAGAASTTGNPDRVEEVLADR